MNIFAEDHDRTNARLAAPVRSLLQSDDRRIAVVGARGWVGRTTLVLLREALGAEDFAARVVCFGSSDGMVEVGDGEALPQLALSRLPTLDHRRTLLLHLAFLTKDKVAGMDAAAYEAQNVVLSREVFDALDAIGVDRLFVASSGAAASADDPAAAADLRLYGRLKRDDEELFAGWAAADPGSRRAAIGRIYSVSGPWINKHDTYALASFILDALAGRPIEVRAPIRVLRSYVAVREVVSLIFAALLAPDGDPVLRFETGGEPLELGDVAKVATGVLGGAVLRKPITGENENRYVGDDVQWQNLLRRYGIEHLQLDDQIAETAAWLQRIGRSGPVGQLPG